VTQRISQDSQPIPYDVQTILPEIKRLHNWNASSPGVREEYHRLLDPVSATISGLLPIPTPTDNGGVKTFLRALRTRNTPRTAPIPREGINRNSSNDVGTIDYSLTTRPSMQSSSEDALPNGRSTERPGAKTLNALHTLHGVSPTRKKDLERAWKFFTREENEERTMRHKLFKGAETLLERTLEAFWWRKNLTERSRR
jgi:hypothetical protein